MASFLVARLVTSFIRVACLHEYAFLKVFSRPIIL